MSEAPFVRVAAAIIRDGSTFLLTRRPEGGRQAGYWEFPGGKIEAGETSEQALARELREELGVEIRVGPLFRRLTHRYDDLVVDLYFHEATVLAGAPSAKGVAAVGWWPAEVMPSLPILPADLALVDDLRRLTGDRG